MIKHITKNQTGPPTQLIYMYVHHRDNKRKEDKETMKRMGKKHEGEVLKKQKMSRDRGTGMTIENM